VEVLSRGARLAHALGAPLRGVKGKMAKRKQGDK
jgi:hypothetical protein